MSMIFSENRFPLFAIMLLEITAPRVPRGDTLLGGGRCRRAAVVETRDLVGDAELRAAAPPLIEDAQDVPFVMRAVAERDRGAAAIAGEDGGDPGDGGKVTSMIPKSGNRFSEKIMLNE